jgi:uncharacterized small protein (DUF1192 family)
MESCIKEVWNIDEKIAAAKDEIKRLHKRRKVATINYVIAPSQR